VCERRTTLVHCCADCAAGCGYASALQGGANLDLTARSLRTRGSRLPPVDPAWRRSPAAMGKAKARQGGPPRSTAGGRLRGPAGAKAARRDGRVGAVPSADAPRRQHQCQECGSQATSPTPLLGERPSSPAGDMRLTTSTTISPKEPIDRQLHRATGPPLGAPQRTPAGDKSAPKMGRL